MRARMLAAALAGAALTVVLAPPASAADRLDRIAGELRREPFYVDPEAADALPQDERGPSAKALAAAGVPVYTVVVPLTSDDESEGDADAFLHSLHDRLGSDGVYVVTDENAGIEVAAYGVPRDVDVPVDVALPPPSASGEPRTAGPRLLQVAEAIRTAPAAAPAYPEPLTTPGPIGEEDPSSWPPFGDIMGVLALGLLLAGPLLGGLLYWVYRLVARMLGYAPPSDGGPRLDAPRRPSTRWLRRTATEELERLGESLAEEDPEARPKVRARAAAAYDAGLLLIEERADPMDLLGAVLLARDGAAMLRDGGQTVRPYCFLNPLHGRTRGQRRRRSLNLPEHHGTGKVPACSRCQSLPKYSTQDEVLVVDGHPYYAHPGFWNETGLRNTDLPARVLEYLGVE